MSEPISIAVETFGTGQVPNQEIVRAVRKVFRLTPREIIESLDLRKPIYKRTASYGHFGRDEFSWERTDKAEALKSEVLAFTAVCDVCRVLA